MLALATAFAVGGLTCLGAAERQADGSRPLLDLAGTISEIGVIRADDGANWVHATIETGARGSVRIRLAPSEVLDHDGFRLNLGDTVRARVFADQDPHDVHRIVNATTARSLRLRCLHGDPLWMGPSKGHGGGRRHQGGASTPPAGRPD